MFEVGAREQGGQPITSSPALCDPHCAFTQHVVVLVYKFSPCFYEHEHGGNLIDAH